MRSMPVGGRRTVVATAWEEGGSESPSTFQRRTNHWGLARASVRTSGATTADITLFGEECRLVQLIPTLLTMRATQALATPDAAAYDYGSAELIRESLHDVPLRVAGPRRPPCGRRCQAGRRRHHRARSRRR